MNKMNKYSFDDFNHKISKAVNVTPAISELNKLGNNISFLTNSIKALREAVSPYYIKFFQTALDIHRAIEKDTQERLQYKQTVMFLWKQFENELINNNRYFPKSELLPIFENLAKEAKCYLNKNTKLYRARKFIENDFTPEVYPLIQDIMNYLNNPDRLPNKKGISDFTDIIDSIPIEIWETDYLNKYNLQNTVFWGFNAEQSDANPKPNISGRINPVGISYLYTAKNIDTAISEIQPTIEHIISVAEIRTLKRLNIFNFDYPDTYKNSEIMNKTPDDIEEQLNINSFWDLGVFFNTLSDLFSRPITENSEYYLTTQYLSELIKKMGFDGIKYKSSLKKDGYNIVLFDTSKDENGNHANYKIVNSYLHKIHNVKVSSKKILPK
jgi:hypothetical protein